MNINFDKPFTLIKRHGEPHILMLEGSLNELDELKDIPRKNASLNDSEKIFDTISVLPFSQIREKGCAVIRGDEKILSLDVENFEYITMDDFFDAITDVDIELESEIEYSLNEDEYGELISKVIKDEIGNGEGANFVIPRIGKAKIKNCDHSKILTIFKRILKNETGSYWSFLFFDGNRYIIGSSPERNVSVRNNHVRMNPISGTYRKPEITYDNIGNIKQDFLAFLQNKKEINELFMVVDEELKMMSNICSEGGMVIGPLLKEMSQLIHTEYLLSGKTSMDLIDVLKESMFAATVTGSPIENACNIICKYENEPRRYYSSAIALIGRENGDEFLDSCITIRTFEIDLEGNILLRVGGTLVRDSDIQEEIEETKFKIFAMANSLLNNCQKNDVDLLNFFRNDDEIAEVLQMRNQYLSNFWFFNQSNKNLVLDKKVLIIHNGDDFCYMIQHMLSTLGLTTKIVSYANCTDEDLKSVDLVIVGPGPGNPLDLTQAKMKKNTDTIRQIMEDKTPFIAICLGHQLLCQHLRIPLRRKEVPHQGIQKDIIFFDKPTKAGFYNTFEGEYIGDIEGIQISYSETTKEVYGLKTKSFHSYQFHVESILSQDGYEILKDSIVELI